MTRDDIIYELKQKLEMALKEKDQVDLLEKCDFHCTQSEKKGYCTAIKQCIKWIETM